MTPTREDAGLGKAPNDGTVLGRFQMGALRPGVVRPLACWLCRNLEAGSERNECLWAIERWLVRIRLTRRNPGNHARFRKLREEIEKSPKSCHELIIDELDWPTNEDVQIAVKRRSMKGHMETARMVLEAIESRAGRRTPPDLWDFEIEHLMPIAWRRDWPHPTEEDEKKRRDEAVWTLGNLTLVSWPLNRALGDDCWQKKRALLKERDEECASAFLTETLSKKEWNEDAIEKRGGQLAGQICTIWPDAQLF